MESFNKVLNERLENLNKLASETQKKKSNLLSEKVSKDISTLLDRLQKLENEHRTSVKKLHQKHANHTQEVTIKTENISSMVTKLAERVSALEQENEQLRKKIDLITYTEDKLKEDLVKLTNKKPEKIVVEKRVIPKVSDKKKIKEEPVYEDPIDADSVPKAPKGSLGLVSADLDKVRLKGKLEEEETLDDEYIRKDLKKSFVSGGYQAWTGKPTKGTNLPEFTITLYGYQFKSVESAEKQYKSFLSEAKNQENHTQEKLSNTSDGWVFEKPVNTVLVKGKEFEIGKAEAVFFKGKYVYDINVSFVNEKMSSSDLKTLVAFLSRRK